MSESDTNKSGVSSALLSIASAYSDSESSEEVNDDSDKSTRGTLGGLVENLRAEAKDTDNIDNITDLEEEGTKEVEEGGKESEKQQSVTKIVRLDSGKVVKISTSPNKGESHANEGTKELKREEIENITMGSFQSSPEKSGKSDDGTENVADESVKNEEVDNKPSAPAVEVQQQQQQSVENVQKEVGEIDEVKEEAVEIDEEVKEEPMEQELDATVDSDNNATESIGKASTDELDSTVQTREIKAELLENVLEVQKDSSAHSKTPEQKSIENFQIFQHKDETEKKKSESVLSKHYDVKNDTVVKTEKSEPKITVTSSGTRITITTSRVKTEPKDVEITKTVKSDHQIPKEDIPKSSVIEQATAKDEKKAESTSAGNKEVAKSEAEADIEEIQIEQEIRPKQHVEKLILPIDKGDTILKKALSSECGTRSLLRKDLNPPVITVNESEDDIEIISSTIKTDVRDSQDRKIVLVREEAKSKSEKKPLPALERIKIRTSPQNQDSLLKKVEPIRIQTSPTGRTTVEQVGTSGSPPGGRKVPGTGPIKLKRNFGDAGADSGKKIRLESSVSPPDMKNAAKTKSQYSSSEEIREILAKRLGSGLDISIIAKKEPSVTIGDLEIIAQPQLSPTKQEPMKSPPRIQIPHHQVPNVHAPGGSRPQLSPTYQQKLAMNYQASFANMINAQNRFPVQSQQQQQKRSPPQGKPQHSPQQHQPQQFFQHPQQHSLLSPTSQHSRVLDKDVMLSPQRPPTVDQRRTVPLIIRRNDVSKKQEVVDKSRKEENRVQPIKLSLREEDVSASAVAKKILGQTEVSTDSSCSSGSELQSSNAPFDSSGSSQENQNFAEGNIDFENMIGSSVVCKETGLTPGVTPPTEQLDDPSLQPSKATYDPTKIKQPIITLEPIPQEIIPVIPTPRKRGRPRKIPQTALPNPNPVVSTWPQDGDEENVGKGGKHLGRAERRKRREATKTVLQKKREESIATTEESKDDDGDDETPKKRRFIPRPPLGKKKRRRGAYSVKRKPATPRKPGSEKENFQNFEEETRMSASEIGSTPSSRGINLGDESQGSLTIEGHSSRTINKKGRMEVISEQCKPITVQQIVEYIWPPVTQLKPGEKPEGLMIQEQISEYLGVKSFKRKYPSIKRRPVDMEERNYLQENGYVSENMCDMGLTAVYSSDIIEIMYSDFPHKFEEYRKYAREKKMKEQKALREKQAAERADIDPKKEAMESIASWNSEFNKTRRDKRSSCLDLQTFTVQFPQGKFKQRTLGKPGHYPVALILGQNTDYYKSYTSTELKYFPLNTVLYGPVRPNERHFPLPGGSDGSQSDSDDSSSGSDDSSSSSSEETQDTEETSSTVDEEVEVKVEKIKIEKPAEKDEDFLPTPIPPMTPKSGRGTPKSGRGRGRGRVIVPKVIDPLCPPKRKGRPPKIKAAPIIFEKLEEPPKDVTEDAVMEPAVPTCKMCHEVESKNKNGEFEKFIVCASCKGRIHPTCIDLTAQMIPKIESYGWQCTDCKSCVKCEQSSNEDKMIFCDLCDRGYHIFCVGLKKVPSGTYICIECKPEETAESSDDIKKEKIEVKTEESNE